MSSLEKRLQEPSFKIPGSFIPKNRDKPLHAPSWTEAIYGTLLTSPPCERTGLAPDCNPLPCPFPTTHRQPPHTIGVHFYNPHGLRQRHLQNRRWPLEFSHHGAAPCRGTVSVPPSGSRRLSRHPLRFTGSHGKGSPHRQSHCGYSRTRAHGDCVGADHLSALPPQRHALCRARRGRLRERSVGGLQHRRRLFERGSERPRNRCDRLPAHHDERDSGLVRTDGLQLLGIRAPVRRRRRHGPPANRLESHARSG